MRIWQRSGYDTAPWNDRYKYTFTVEIEDGVFISKHQQIEYDVLIEDNLQKDIDDGDLYPIYRKDNK